MARAIEKVFRTKTFSQSALLFFFVGVTGICLLAYLNFWLFVFDRHVGTAGAVIFTVTGLVQSVRSWRFLRDQLRDPWMRLCAVCWAYVGIFYGALQRLYILNDGREMIVENATDRFLSLPPDNQLPYITADLLRYGKDYRVILDEWLSSDRPPLQSALYMLFSWGPNGYIYQSLSLILQCLWVVPVLYGVQFFVRSREKAFALVIWLSLVGFIALNSIFVWPKMVAAAFFMMSWLLLEDYFADASKKGKLFLAALAFEFSLLFHSGVGFALPLLAFTFLAGMLKLPNWRERFVSVLYFVGVVLPLQFSWGLYQKFIAPPGNRLLKWHLGGAVDVDSRGVSETIREAYAKLSFLDWWSGREANFNMLYQPYAWERLPARVQQFFHLIPSLGILAIGWIIVFARFAMAPRGEEKKVQLRTFGGLISGLIFWITVMIVPGSTVLHQGSYAIFMLIFSVGAWGLISLPRKWAMTAFAWQIFWFLRVWCSKPEKFFKMQKPGTLRESCAALMVVTFVCFLAFYYREFRKQKLLPR